MQNDVNVPSKSNKQKNFVGVLKFNDENRRIRIHKSEARRSATLVISYFEWQTHVKYNIIISLAMFGLLGETLVDTKT